MNDNVTPINNYRKPPKSKELENLMDEAEKAHIITGVIYKYDNTETLLPTRRGLILAWLITPSDELDLLLCPYCAETLQEHHKELALTCMNEVCKNDTLYYISTLERG